MKLPEVFASIDAALPQDAGWVVFGLVVLVVLIVLAIWLGPKE